MSKKTLLTSNPLIKMLWVIDNSCLIQESPGLKLDFFLEINLLMEEKSTFLLKIIVSETLQITGSKETGP